MKKLIAGMLILGGFQASAQDILFSQTAETPLLINPGATGVYNGWERIQINHRNQWLGANTQFMTSSLACDVNFFKSDRNDKAHLGVGAFFYNDIGGDSRYGTQSGAVSLSGIIPLAGGGHSISAGLQGGFGTRSADLSRVVFESQINGNAFDPTLPSGEPGSLNNFTYLDVSTGFFYQYDSEQSTFARNNNVKFQGGMSMYHVNKPMLRFNGVSSGDALFRKFVAHASYSQDIPSTDWAFDVSAVQFIQGPHYETILGGMGRYRLTDGSKYTGFHRDSYFGFGLYMRVKDAVIPRVLIDWKGFKMGVSYDITISQLARAYKGGSLEFSLAYTNMKYALFKRRNKKL